MDITRKGFEFFEREFDYPYPFEKYDQLFVPEYNMGAMENPGCVTFTEVYVFRSRTSDYRRERRVVTILHELAHMWFGDLVTMKWWNDLWLNESFAEYVSTMATAEATEWKGAWATFTAAEKTWAYHQDALPSTHPIVAPINDLEDVYTNFDGITYAKGASVLKQLAEYVGRDAFMKGLGNYFKKYAFSNTTLTDLLAELEGTSGRPLLVWAQKWLEQPGTNTLRAAFDTDDAGIITTFAVEQTAPDQYPVLRPQTLSVGFYNRQADGSVVRNHQVTFDIDGAFTEVNSLVGHKRPDLLLVNDDDLTFAKIRLDDASARFATEHLRDIEDPVARALIWAGMWDMVTDAEIAASSFVDLALGNLDAETNSTTIAQVLNDLNQATYLYSEPSDRTTSITRIGDELWKMASSAAHGSDLQLQLARAFAANASTAEHAASLRGLLDGSVSLDGLTVDTDLKWDLIQGLAINNALADGEVDRALAADDTASGRQAAARVRASIATPEAKAKAFELMTSKEDVPNAIIRETAAGFNRVVDSSLLAPFISPYVEALHSIWDSKSFHIAEELISGFYPYRVASPDLRDAVQTWLEENPGAAPSLRRLVIEELADTERALAGQAISTKHAH
jgi:aminopeptidase N